MATRTILVNMTVGPAVVSLDDSGTRVVDAAPVLSHLVGRPAWAVHEFAQHIGALVHESERTFEEFMEFCKVQRSGRP
jgi:hypothetical protein